MTCFYFFGDFLDFVKLILFFMQGQDGGGDRLVGAGNVVQSAKRRTKKSNRSKKQCGAEFDSRSLYYTEHVYARCTTFEIKVLFSSS